MMAMFAQEENLQLQIPVHYEQKELLLMIVKFYEKFNVEMASSIQLKSERMAIKTLPLMDVPNLVPLMMDMLVLEDQLLVRILALFVYQLEELYQVTKEAENLCEEMDSNMI